MILLPFMVVLFQAIVLHIDGLGDTAFRQTTPWNIAMRVAVAFFLGVDLVLFVTTATLFAKTGRATLAPWKRPQHPFVVSSEDYLFDQFLVAYLTDRVQLGTFSRGTIA